MHCLLLLSTARVSLVNGFSVSACASVIVTYDANNGDGDGGVECAADS